MKLEEKMVSSENVYDGRLLHVKKDKIILPNGHESTREYITHFGASAILPILPNGKILMERQFRYPSHRIFLEIPAGKLDSADEDPKDCAIRELKEETGAVAESIEYLGCVHPTIAYSTEAIYCYVAKDIRFEKQDLDEDEFVELVEYSLEELLTLLKEDKIQDSKTAYSIMKYALFLAK